MGIIFLIYYKDDEKSQKSFGFGQFAWAK